MITQDTITAVATPIGEGAIALVRMSGPDALSISHRIFARGTSGRKVHSYELKPNHAYFGIITDNSEVIDEVMLTYFRAPKSYTREDMIEISCHGGSSVVGRILSATLKNGARSAEPGEYTRRAFLNGRIDLTQAEAVAELIAANSELARKSAIKQLEGSLRKVIERLRNDLISCLAEIEASIDFPEESVTSEATRHLQDRILSISASLDSLKYTTAFALNVRNGFKVPIVGLPNVGKSSLLNAMLSKERAIVSPIPGTTRDTIEEIVSIDGIPFRLIDTAGIRETGDHVEQQGVERTRRAVEEADIILMVTEAGRSHTVEERQLLDSTHPSRLIVVLNKSDLAPETHPLMDTMGIRSCVVSSRTGDGITELRRILVSSIKCCPSMKHEVEFLVNARHHNAISNAKACLSSALASISSSMPIEVVASDVRLACNSLGEVIGVVTTDDILDSVFSSFCIGK